jgi:hypothetical protein
MSTTRRVAVFAFMYVAVFLGAMAAITGGVVDVAGLVSIPVIMSADAMVLGMIYLATFHGEDPEQHEHLKIPKLTSYESFLSKVEKKQPR